MEAVAADVEAVVPQAQPDAGGWTGWIDQMVSGTNRRLQAAGSEVEVYFVWGINVDSNTTLFSSKAVWAFDEEFRPQSIGDALKAES